MEHIKDIDPDFADIQMKKTLSQKLNNKTLEGVEEFWCTVEHIDLPKSLSDSYWEYYMACAEDWNNIEGLPEGRKNKTYLDYLFNYLKLQTIYTEELEDIGVTKKNNTTKLCQRTIKIACDNNTYPDGKITRSMLEFYEKNSLYKFITCTWMVVFDPELWTDLAKLGLEKAFFLVFYENLMTGKFVKRSEYCCQERYGNLWFSIESSSNSNVDKLYAKEKFEGLRLAASVNCERVPVIKDGNKKKTYIYRQILKVYKAISKKLYGAGSFPFEEYFEPFKDALKYHHNKGVPFWDSNITSKFFVRTK